LRRCAAASHRQLRSPLGFVGHQRRTIIPALSSGFDPVVAGLVGSQHRSDHYENVLFTTTGKVSGLGFLILWQYKLPTRTGWHDQFPPARSRLCEKRSRCLERSVATRTPILVNDKLCVNHNSVSETRSSKMRVGDVAAKNVACVAEVKKYATRKSDGFA